MIAVRRQFFSAFCAIGAASVGIVSPAAAVTATQLLNDYNLIVFGNLTSTSEVDGKTYVGGNVTGGNYDIHNVNQGSGKSALTVGGNLSGNVNVNGSGVAIGGNLATSNYNGNGGGNVYIGQSWTGSANFNQNGSGNVYLGGTKTGSGNVNGGTLNQNQSSSSFTSNLPSLATTTAIQNSLTSYSASLTGLNTNSFITVSAGKATFNAAPNASGLAVFNITNAASFFSGLTEILFSLNNATEVIINVSGAGAGTLDIAANFLNGIAPSLATTTLWNFTDATSIDFERQFGGDILAVYAAVTLNGNEEGTLVANSLIQKAEVHYDGANPNLPSLTPTPLPGALPMFGTAALCLAGFLLAGRKKLA